MTILSPSVLRHVKAYLDSVFLAKLLSMLLMLFTARSAYIDDFKSIPSMPLCNILKRTISWISRPNIKKVLKSSPRTSLDCGKNEYIYHAWVPFRNQAQRENVNLRKIPCTAKTKFQNLKQIFPEKEYRGLSPNFHIHVSVSELYIPTMGLPFLLEGICGRILGIYKSLTDAWILKLGLSEAAQFPEKEDINGIVVAVWDIKS